jgi:replicative DNA helicase
LFLYRDELYNPDREHNPSELEIFVAKNRNGPTDCIRAWYAPNLSKISNLASDESDFYEHDNDNTAE